jgi:HPr kinase/phosphorylase
LSDQESCAIPTMAVRELLSDADAESLGLNVLAGGNGLDNLVTRTRIQMPGLALAGFLEYIDSGRVQILGKYEMIFLQERPPA